MEGMDARCGRYKMKAFGKHLLEYLVVERKEMILLLLCLVIGFGLRFYAFDHKSLWIDEIHTFNDSRDDLKGQIKFYKGNPTYLHPPLFFVLTHLFHPFTNPERDLRILPLIFGTLSIPLFYFVARCFSPGIAFPCALSLTFMTYHIYLSQDGRSYTMAMFLGMGALYFFLMHLRTSKKRYLFPAALLFSILFQTSYASLPFIVFSQLLLFYRFRGDQPRPSLSSFLVLNGLILFFSAPWLLFIALNYKRQLFMDPQHTEDPGSLWNILHGVFNDWVSNTPLVIASVVLFILFLFFSKSKRNALILVALFFFPIGSLYLFCKAFNITHFFTSRYFVNLLPLFFISIYLSLEGIETKFERFRQFTRLKLLFVFFLIASNFVILPLYYRSEKQNFGGLITYLKNHLKSGDIIFIPMKAYLPGILHYFGAYPRGRHYVFSYSKDLRKGLEYGIYLAGENKWFWIYSSDTCCVQYLTDANRVWIVVSKSEGKKLKRESPFVLKGYFDGSFANFRKFPTDASIYLFLWDPKSPDEKRMELPMDRSNGGMITIDPKFPDE